jgi:molecular chaperone GrpE (heat shock protein)
MTPNIPLLMNAAALCAAPLTLAGYLFVRSRRERRREPLTVVIRRLLDEKFRAAELLTSAGLTPLTDRIDDLRDDVAELARLIEHTLATPPPEPPRPAGDPIALEHQILSESWKQLRKNNELSAALDEALQDRAWTQLLDQLGNVVPGDLKPTFDAVIVPCREHRSLLQRIDLIPRILDGEIGRLTTDAEEIRRTRELASLLNSELDRVLDFRVKSWVTDSFLPFADLYLQRCQQAQIEKRDGAMSEGLTLVRNMLRIAAVEPIDVTPGETLFDSTRHVGRSTSNDPRFADGVITGVVRNGFIEGGQLVIRQPEVIVNRMR